MPTYFVEPKASRQTVLSEDAASEILGRLEAFWAQNAKNLASLSNEKFAAFIALILELLHAIVAALGMDRERAVSAYHDLLSQLDGTDPTSQVGG